MFNRIPYWPKASKMRGVIAWSRTAATTGTALWRGGCISIICRRRWFYGGAQDVSAAI